MFNSFLIGTLIAVFAARGSLGAAVAVPQVIVHACPNKGTIIFDTSVPDKTAFPHTEVDLCYDLNGPSLHLTFKAFNETNFFFNATQTTNSDIWQYEVMEAFIYHGSNDPTTYLEFEVNPNNVTYQAFVYNPSKVRQQSAPFDHFFSSDPISDGFAATTTLDRNTHSWVSDVVIPLALFNVENLPNSSWRMNFFRTITSPDTFPNQVLGSWNPPNQASFHITPFFGNVVFV